MSRQNYSGTPSRPQTGRTVIRDAVDEVEAVLAAKRINSRTRRENKAKRVKPVTLATLQFMRPIEDDES